jgi:hypothetical protein
MIKNRKLTLEQRIARLENVLKASRRGTRKFESANMALDLESALDDELGEFYSINVTSNNGRLIADVDDGQPEWSIGGTFEVVPTKTYYEVNVLGGDGKFEYEIGTASDMEEAAELIAEEIDKWAMDL